MIHNSKIVEILQERKESEAQQLNKVRKFNILPMSLLYSHLWNIGMKTRDLRIDENLI